MRISAKLRVALLLLGVLGATQAFAGSVVGGSRFAVLIDARGAEIVRAWRAAHGLDSTMAGLASETSQRRSLQAAAWQRQCLQDGGAVNMQTARVEGAGGTAVRTGICL